MPQFDPTKLERVEWLRIGAILDELFDLPPKARAGALDRLTLLDRELRARLQALLEADQAGEDLLRPDHPSRTSLRASSSGSGG